MNVNKNMIRRLGILALVAAAVVLLVGCSTESDGVSITDRINQLASDLNNNYSQVYLNWHPESNTRQIAADPDTLNTEFPPDESGTYTITNIVVDGSNATATFNSERTFLDDAATFQMLQDGDDWFIDSLTVGNNVSLNSILGRP